MGDPMTLLVEGLRFHGYHGVFDWEQEQGREFLVDIRADVDQTASLTDRIEDSVDYVALSRVMLEISESRKFRTLEALAGSFLDVLFDRFPRVQTATVCIRKERPDVGHACVAVGVECSRARSTH